MATKEKPTQAIAAKGLTADAELMARFQLETDGKLEGFRRWMLEELSRVERRVAVNDDRIGAAQTELASLRTAVSNATDDMRRGLNDANLALEKALRFADEAKQSAAVYEKLRDSQPDVTSKIQECQVENGKVLDELLKVRERLALLAGDLQRVALLAADAGLGGGFIPEGIVTREIQQIGGGFVQVG